MKAYDEKCTQKRHEYNGQIMGIVANALSSGFATPENLQYKTGLDHNAVTLALNLLHTKDAAICNGGVWYKI